MLEGLAALQFLLGDWEGDESGEAGSGRGERSYRPRFDRFIETRTRTVYPPQEVNPSGEVHEELGFFSYDVEAGEVVLRELHTEGFVITYTLAENETELVFVSREFENGPPGMRARLTLRAGGADSFQERFELAPASGSFKEYVRSEWVRRH